MATEAVRSTVDVPVAFTIITGIARRCGRSGSPGISQGSVKRVSGVSWSAGELLCQWPGGQAASRSDGGLGQTGLGVLLPPASIASVIVTPVCAMAQPSTQVAGLGGSTSVSSSQPSQYLTPALNSQGPWTPSCPVSQGAYFLFPASSVLSQNLVQMEPVCRRAQFHFLPNWRPKCAPEPMWR